MSNVGNCCSYLFPCHSLHFLNALVSPLSYSLHTPQCHQQLVYATKPPAAPTLSNSPLQLQTGNITFTYILTGISLGDQGYYSCSYEACQGHQKLNSFLTHLDKVQSKAIRLINNPKLTKSLQPRSHRRLVGNLSIFYRYFHGHCSQEIRDIIPVPRRRVMTTRSSTHSHPFQVSLPTPPNSIPRTCNL